MISFHQHKLYLFNLFTNKVWRSKIMMIMLSKNEYFIRKDRFHSILIIHFIFNFIEIVILIETCNNPKYSLIQVTVLFFS